MRRTLGRGIKTYFSSLFQYDIKASITVFFVALPLCLGVALASNAPVSSGLISGIIGGIIVTVLSRSELSVSGPAAGLTAICAAAIVQLGGIDVFFLSVAIAGLMQILLGVLRLGGFTHFIPSAVIKGMLAAIGIILISKQIPPFIGYNKPQFWSGEFFNIITFNHVFSNAQSLFENISLGAIIISSVSLIFLLLWDKYLAKRLSWLSASFIVVLLGVIAIMLFNTYLPSLKLNPSQLVSIPENFVSEIHFSDFTLLFTDAHIWTNAIVICFVASLETLLSIAAIDKLDPLNRVSPQNRELMAQGTGNFVSGLIGGLPITAVIVRSAANAEAGAKTRFSAFMHGTWLLLAVLFAIPLINYIPYCVLAAILVRTGYNLVKPKMIMAIYRQGREQFLPFMVTVISILLTDLIIGVLIGIGYAVYFLVKHTYRAGFTVKKEMEGDRQRYTIELALNVSFLNKQKLVEMLDKIPEYAVVDIIGSRSVYIDHDILEIFQEYKAKAKKKHIQLTLKDIKEVEVIEMH